MYKTLRNELPTEIVDVVVSHIDDRPTLYSCSLTCRRWLPASRFHLFRNLSITSRTNYDILVRVRDTPHISHSFDNLYSLQLWEDQERPWVHLLPLLLSRRLAHVELLTLAKFRWHDFPLHPTFYTIGYSMPSLTSLTLVRGSFFSFREFRTLVCSFERLSELIIERVAWRTLPSYPHCVSASRLPRLRLLWVNSGCEGVLSALVDWLLRTPSASSIRDLKLGDYGIQSSCDVPVVQRLTRALGASLESYELPLMAWTPGEEVSTTCCSGTDALARCRRRVRPAGEYVSHVSTRPEPRSWLSQLACDHSQEKSLPCESREPRSRSLYSNTGSSGLPSGSLS
ncbi:hypothetical protein C8Q76DRAFT_405448 [Earliella scabrosa]|nr:hypothetical protein C8Q76DRAFT_405448 [Earliella scabrosa]